MTDTGQKADLPAVLRQVLPHILRHSRLIAFCAKGYGWAVPVMAVFSLLISVTETLAIGLVVVFLYEAIGPGAQATVTSGLLAAVLRTISDIGGDTAIALAAVIFGLVLAKAVLRVAYDLLVAHIKHVIIERARNAVYRQLLEVSYGYVQSRERGDLMNALASQTWAVADAFYCLARIGAALVAIAVFGAILIAISWEITLLAAIGAVLVFTVLRLLAGPTRHLGEAATEAHRKLSGEMLNTLQGMRTIRAYGQEGARRRLFQEAARRTRKIFVRMEQLVSVITPVSEITYLGLLALIVWYSTASSTSFAATLSAVALLYRLQPHLRELEGKILYLARLDAPLASVQEILRREDKSYPPTGFRPFAGLKDEIRFERVSLAYGDAERPSLRSLSLSIPVGETTALVGPSGAGKTSIIALLLRLYEPSNGRILVDGVPLAEIERSGWLKRVAVAGQDVELIDDTIAANIRLARPDASREEIEQAARRAGIYDFIAQLPDGFASWIGTQGLNLSGGQRQRIGLARALICQPELLILDEATNAVDGQLEIEIRNNIAAAMAGGTLIVITHRLTSIADIDNVIHIVDGAIVDKSSGDSLVPTPTAMKRKLRSI